MVLVEHLLKTSPGSESIDRKGREVTAEFNTFQTESLSFKQPLPWNRPNQMVGDNANATEVTSINYDRGTPESTLEFVNSNTFKRIAKLKADAINVQKLFSYVNLPDYIHCKLSRMFRENVVLFCLR